MTGRRDRTDADQRHERDGQPDHRASRSTEESRPTAPISTGPTRTSGEIGRALLGSDGATDVDTTSSPSRTLRSGSRSTQASTPRPRPSPASRRRCRPGRRAPAPQRSATRPQPRSHRDGQLHGQRRHVLLGQPVPARTAKAGGGASCTVGAEPDLARARNRSPRPTAATRCTRPAAPARHCARVTAAAGRAAAEVRRPEAQGQDPVAGARGADEGPLLAGQGQGSPSTATAS